MYQTIYTFDNKFENMKQQESLKHEETEYSIFPNFKPHFWEHSHDFWLFEDPDLSMKTSKQVKTPASRT